MALFTPFPFAYLHAAGYAESLTVFFTASAILLALDERHVAAGLVLTVGCAGAIGLLFRRALRRLAPYALLLMALYWKTGLMGLGRFSALCWPTFLPPGSWLARRPALLGLLVLIMAMAQGFYFFLWSHWFGIF